jgi:hypothetical protein
MPQPTAVTKERFITELCKKYSKQSVVALGRTVRLEVPTRDTGEREAIAVVLAKSYKGKVKSKRTEVQFSGYSLVVKPKGASGTKTNEKFGSVYYGILGKLNLSEMDTSELREVDSSFSNTKKLPKTLKEKSDIAGISDFNKKLEAVTKTSNGVDLRIGKFKVQNVVGVIAVVGKEPKTDYVMVSKEGKKLYPSFYISYKMGTSAKDFQNYSGISEKTSDLIWQHKETKKFFKVLQTMTEMKQMEEHKQEISDTDIIRQSMYGQDYGKKYGLDNVNILAQGDVRIAADGRVSFSHMIENGTVPDKRDPYHPVFGARLATGRGAKTPFGTTITGFRIGIFPRAYRTRWMIVD